MQKKENEGKNLHAYLAFRLLPPANKALLYVSRVGRGQKHGDCEMVFWGKMNTQPGEVTLRYQCHM